MPSMKRNTATAGSTYAAVASSEAAQTSTNAPNSAPTPPGTASQTIFDQSTLPKLECEIPETAVVPISAMCTAADASAGATPAANNTVVDDTPYAIPNDPSTSWATTPARASRKKFFIYSNLPIVILSIVFVTFTEPGGTLRRRAKGVKCVAGVFCWAPAARVEGAVFSRRPGLWRVLRRSPSSPGG